MKINATSSWLIATLLSTTGLWASGAARADDLERAKDAVGKSEQLIQSIQGGQQIQPPQPSEFGRSWGGQSAFFSGGRAGTNISSAIRKAAEAVRDAKGDEAKSAAQKKLAELLSKCYDEDMVQREHDLKQIEERLTKLRDLLDRRRTKKQEIIDLQTKVALNESEGLGFYDNERPAKGGAGNFYYSTVAPRVETSGSAPDVFSAKPMPTVDSVPVVPKASSR